MAKKSQRRPARYERQQSGCMWGLISMFGFHHGRPTQNLLSDGRRGCKHVVGVGNPKDKLDSVDANGQGILDGEEFITSATDIGKPSVKKLIEEEMFNEQRKKAGRNDAEVEPKQSNSERGSQKRKNLKRTSRSRTKSCDIDLEDLDILGNSEPEWPCLQNSENQSTNNLDIDQILEQFYNQIHKKGISCIKHDQQGEVHDQMNQKNPEIEEKLGEAMKLISEKLINSKYLTGDGDAHLSKELRDALQILSSDEEFFLKLLQGPKSMMVKYVQIFLNAQVVKDENLELFVGSNLSEQGLCDSGQSDDAVLGKQHKFLRRKTKSLENNHSKGNKASQASDGVVILKPGPMGMQNLELEGFPDLSPESKLIARNKGPNERVSSHFSLTEIKKKFKHAIGKQRQEISTDGNLRRVSKKHKFMGDSDKVFKENPGRNSPSKDHFFIEKIARPPIGAKKKEKASKVEECEISTQNETVNFSKQRPSNIYIEAKKHLSEMLSSGPGDVDFSSQQIPKTLGRILSLPEYNFSPIDSPGRDWEQSLVTAQTRLSVSDEYQRQEKNASHLGRTTLNLGTRCVSDDCTDNKVQAPSNHCLTASNDQLRYKDEEKPFCSIGDEMTSEADVEIVKATEIVVEEESNISDTLSEPSTPSITIDDQNGGMYEACDDKASSSCLKNDSHEEHHFPPSPLISPSTSTVTKKVIDLEEAAVIPDRPSPKSVLEPLFSEEDVGPAGTRSEPVESLVVPLRLQFEELDQSTAGEGTHLKTRIEDKELIFEFVKAVMQASGLSWDDFYMGSHSSDQLLDPSILVEVEFFSNELCCEKRLLFDCINEVLIEVYRRYLGFFHGSSFVKSTVRPALDMKNAICEVWAGVYWHLLPLPMPRTLDQIVKKDLSKTGMWMDLRYDTESILVEIGDAIFEDLIDEVLLSCANESCEVEIL